jgi:Holliday junction resolvase RusA-like endonuclease
MVASTTSDPFSVEVTIQGEPVAQGRARGYRTRRGQLGFYDPAKSRAWKETASLFFRSAMGSRTPLEGPLFCLIRAFFPCPLADHRKHHPKPERPHWGRPDAENVAKAVLDAGTGVLWLDDAQVASLHVEKAIAAQGAEPRVEVLVARLPALKTVAGVGEVKCPAVQEESV